jgi:hypothetical protein
MPFINKYNVGTASGGGVSDHGSLTGLTDNDHPQYPLFLKTHYERSAAWAHGGTSTATQRRSIDSPDEIQVKVDTSSLFTSSSSSYDLNTDGTWDFGQDIGTWAADTAYSEGDFVRPSTPNNYVYKCTSAGTSDSSEPTWGTTVSGTTSDNTATWTCYNDDAVAAKRAGVDYYIYACEPASGTTPDIIISREDTTPHGYTATNSRKIGGFHCLCVSVGTISGHALTGFLQGDILPASIWDLKHRSHSENEGMVYDEDLGIWVDIYLASGTGSSTASAYGGTISDTRDWMDFVGDGKAVKKRLLRDHEFQSIAEGSNQETNISGSADPGTTGGHSDTASRRMISDIGCEDCCGALWQWLDEQSYRADGTSWGWQDLGSKGSLYKQGTYGDVKLLAGGDWDDGSNCGSRARHVFTWRWYTYANLGARFAARSRTV